MHGIYNKLPRSVTIKNQTFKINTDYRIFIDFEQEMQDKDKLKAINKALSRFYYPAFFDICKSDLLDEAIDKFIWFYKCGHLEENVSSNKKESKNIQIYSYKYDDLYIWGTFYQYFHIDLSVSRLHWWKFRALWLVIPNDANYSKIKGYRGYSGKDKDILELKDFYKLPLTEAEINEQVRRNKIYETLKKFS